MGFKNNININCEFVLFYKKTVSLKLSINVEINKTSFYYLVVFFKYSLLQVLTISLVQKLSFKIYLLNACYVIIYISNNILYYALFFFLIISVDILTLPLTRTE